MALLAGAQLTCRRCRAQRPEVCAACGSSRLLALRIGVSRAAEELAALTGMRVEEVSGPASPQV
jgi:primosomal protein N'